MPIRSLSPKSDYRNEPRKPLPGSDKPTFAAASARRPASSRKRISVSVIVHCSKPISTEAIAGKHLTRVQFKAAHGSDPSAVRSVTAFAKAFGLTATSDVARRTVVLTGTVANMQKAFGVELHDVDDGGSTYRLRTGEIHVPESLLPHVVAVLGLDNRQQAKPHFRVARARVVSGSFTPPQLAGLYSFPKGASAAGQTIALIELGGGFRAADITAYFKSLGITAPAVTAVLVDGGTNSPTNASGADAEVMLDIEVAASIAAGAKVAVYFAPNTDQGFVDAITTATHDTTNKPTVMSISWGGPESTWTGQARNALDQACQAAAALGITITAAAGDNGSDDGVGDGSNHVDFPASSPNVLACGGTRLTASGTAISSEVVWNEVASNEGATGGGISNVFPQPAWQTAIAATQSGRGVPDVAGNADPTTGYQVRVDGQTMVIGGTSAVAPLWAGLIALSNAANHNAAGLIQPKLYAAAGSKAFRDIVVGNNGSFQAAPGWDACTGLGTPIGTAVVALLAGNSPGRKPVKKKSAKNASQTKTTKR